MPDIPLHFDIDHAQPRAVRDRQTTVVAGLYEQDGIGYRPTNGWSRRWGSVDAAGEFTTMVDPVTGTLMLTPAPWSPLWATQTSGIYAKLGKTDFTLAGSSAGYVEHNKNGAGSKYISLADSAQSDRSAVTVASYVKNRAFYVAYEAFNSGGDRFAQFECGYGATADYTQGLAFRFMAGGEVEVWKGGEFVEKGSLSKERDQGQQTDGQTVRVLIIPFRQREVLILSSWGGGFVTVFDDISEDDPDPEISPAGKFWWKIPSGAGSVECAPVKYPSSGWRASVAIPRKEAPSVGAIAQFASASGGSGTLATQFARDLDATLAFVPDGVTRRYRLRADLGGDGDSTPFVYSATGWFPTETEETDDSERLRLDLSVLEASLEVPENPSGVRFSVRLKDPYGLSAEDSARIGAICNRPGLLSYGDLPIVDGIGEPPKVILAPTGETTRAELSFRDWWSLFEQYQFREDIPLDGMTFREAFITVATAAGFPEDRIDCDGDDFRLEAPEGSGSRGDFAVLIKVGDSADRWIQRLHETYAGNWHIGIRPTESGVRLQCLSPETIGEEPKIKLYLSHDDAIADGVAEEEAWKYVLRTFAETRVPPEANEIHVTGIDLRRRRPIHVFRRDEDSIDPTLAPSERPDNWLGGLCGYAFGSPSLTTQAMCERACNILFERLTPGRWLADCLAEWMIGLDSGLPLWRGDCVEIDGKGVWRIVSLSMRPVLEPEEADEEEEYPGRDGHWRPTSYVLEKIVDGTAKGLGGRSFGSTAEQIRQFLYRNLASEVRYLGDFGEVTSRPPVLTVVL